LFKYFDNSQILVFRLHSPAYTQFPIVKISSMLFGYLLVGITDQYAKDIECRIRDRSVLVYCFYLLSLTSTVFFRHRSS
jgi:hypothetical protein